MQCASLLHLNLDAAASGCQARQHPGVSVPPRAPPAFSPLEQRDQVLAGESEAVPQRRRRRRAQFPQRPLKGGPELGQGSRRREVLLVHLFYPAGASELREQHPDGGAGELLFQLRDGGHPPPGFGQPARERRLGAAGTRVQRRRPAREPRHGASHLECPLAPPQIKDLLYHRLGHASPPSSALPHRGPQGLERHPGLERMALVVSPQELGHPGHFERHRRACDQPRPAGKQRFTRRRDDTARIPWEDAQSHREVAGGEPYLYALTPRTGFLLELDDIPAEAVRRAKLVYLNYPNNPTAAVAPRDYLERTVDFCRRHDILIAYDNPYCEITFDDYVAPSILEIPGAREIAVEFHSLSKSFCMTGWRLGWAVGRPELIAALARVKNYVDTGAFLAVQAAGAAVLPQAEAIARGYAARLRERRDAILPALRAQGFEPDTPRATMYVWVPLPEGVPAAAV